MKRTTKWFSISVYDDDEQLLFSVNADVHFYDVSLNLVRTFENVGRVEITFILEPK